MSLNLGLNTLLEAAKFLEMQEQKEQQHRAAVEAALTLSRAPLPPISTTTRNTFPVAITQKINNGSVVITTATNQQETITDETMIKIKNEPIDSSQSILTTASATNPLITAQIKSEIPPTSATKQTSPTTVVNTAAPPRRILHNSFDIMNPLVIDEGDTHLKRRQPPLAFRAGTREVHNKLEKHRRAHLKECFDVLKKQLPATQDEKKTSNLSILHSALRYIQTLKRRERELEHEMERLARDKISAQQRLAVLKRDISTHYDNVDFSKILPEVIPTTPPPRPPSTTTTTLFNNNEHLENDFNESHESDSLKSSPSSSNASTSPILSGSITGPIDGINGKEKVPITLLPTRGRPPIATKQIKELQLQQQPQPPLQQQQQQQQPVQPTALSVLPVGYPVSQGLVLQKLIVPKAITDLPLVSTHFITQQQLNGKVVPLMNAQYVVKPVVVVSRPS